MQSPDITTYRRHIPQRLSTSQHVQRAGVHPLLSAPFPSSTEPPQPFGEWNTFDSSFVFIFYSNFLYQMALYLGKERANQFHSTHGSGPQGTKPKSWFWGVTALSPSSHDIITASAAYIKPFPAFIDSLKMTREIKHACHGDRRAVIDYALNMAVTGTDAIEYVFLALVGLMLALTVSAG